jgi:hypothetical protein
LAEEDSMRYSPRGAGNSTPRHVSTRWFKPRLVIQTDDVIWA